MLDRRLTASSSDDPRRASIALPSRLARIARGLPNNDRGAIIDDLARELRLLGYHVATMSAPAFEASEQTAETQASRGAHEIVRELLDEQQCYVCEMSAPEWSTLHTVVGGPPQPLLLARIGYATVIGVVGDPITRQDFPWWTALFEDVNRQYHLLGDDPAEIEVIGDGVVAQLAHEVSSHLNAEDIIQTMTNTIADALPHTGAAILTVDPDRQRCRALHWNASETAAGRTEVAMLLNRPDVRLCVEQALSPPRSIAIPDLARHRPSLPWGALGAADGVTSLLVEPALSSSQTVTCTLLVWTREPRQSLNAGQRSLIANIGVVGASALEHATILDATTAMRQPASDERHEAPATVSARRPRSASRVDQDRLAAVFDAMLFGLVLVGLDSRVLRINPTGRRVLELAATGRRARLRSYRNVDPRFLLGSPVPHELFPLAGPIPGLYIGNLDFSIRTRAGSRKELGLTGVPVPGSEDGLQAMVYVFRDVSERRRLERQKNEFLSIASHELKTPLTSLKGYVQALTRRIERHRDAVSLDDVAERLLRMNRQVDRIAVLIEDMLDISRAQSGKLSLRLEPFDLRDVVSDVLERTFPPPTEDERGHPLEIALPDQPVIGNWDRSRIDQVLTNLVTNAAKYSVVGSPITLTLTRRENVAALDIQDRGIGIPADEQEHIFQPFFRARNASSNEYGGIGLGLYLSRELALRHGGDITLESVEGQGSTFHLELPYGDPAPIAVHT